MKRLNIFLYFNRPAPGKPDTIRYGPLWEARATLPGGLLFVDRRLSRRAGLPAAVDPQPLIGIGADRGFESGVQSRRVARGIARNFHRRIEPQHVAALVFHPQRVGRNYRRAAVRGDFGKAHAGAGGHAEEIDEHAGLERRVLVDQDADFVIAGDSAAATDVAAVDFDSNVAIDLAVARGSQLTLVFMN